jgi:hypothetical protein
MFGGMLAMPIYWYLHVWHVVRRDGL